MVTTKALHMALETRLRRFIRDAENGKYKGSLEHDLFILHSYITATNLLTKIPFTIDMELLELSPLVNNLIYYAELLTQLDKQHNVENHN